MPCDSCIAPPLGGGLCLRGDCITCCNCRRLLRKVAQLSLFAEEEEEVVIG